MTTDVRDAPPSMLEPELESSTPSMFATSVLAKLAQPVEPALHDKWLEREQTFTAFQRELRNVGGRIGHWGLAAAEGANAVSRLKAIGPGTELDLRVMHGLDQLFHRLDTRVADVVEESVRRNAYVARASAQRLAVDPSQMVVRSTERYVPLAEADHLTVIGLVRTRLRPRAEESARSRRGRQEPSRPACRDRPPTWWQNGAGTGDLSTSERAVGRHLRSRRRARRLPAAGDRRDARWRGARRAP